MNTVGVLTFWIGVVRMCCLVREDLRSVYIVPIVGLEVHLPHGCFLLHTGSDEDVGWHGGGTILRAKGIARYMIALYLKLFNTETPGM